MPSSGLLTLPSPVKVQRPYEALLTSYVYVPSFVNTYTASLPCTG